MTRLRPNPVVILRQRPRICAPGRKAKEPNKVLSGIRPLQAEKLRITCIGNPFWPSSDGSPLTACGDDGKSLSCPTFPIGHPSGPHCGWISVDNFWR